MLEHVGTCWNWALKHDFSRLSVTNLEELGYWEISFWCYCKYYVFLFLNYVFFSIDCWWFLWTLAKWDINWSKLMRNILEPRALHGDFDAYIKLPLKDGDMILTNSLSTEIHLTRWQSWIGYPVFGGSSSTHRDLYTHCDCWNSPHTGWMTINCKNHLLTTQHLWAFQLDHLWWVDGADFVHCSPWWNMDLLGGQW
jgi:hypothetical protein